MDKIKIVIKGNHISPMGEVDLVAGTIGQVCKFYFEEEWKNLNKKITYKVGPTILGTYDIIADETTIPPHVLRAGGLPLEIGLTGFSSDKTIVKPTHWCPLGTVHNGAVIYTGGNEKEEDYIVYDGGMIT